MNNPIVDKSLDFAVRIVRFARVIKSRKEFELAKQVLRSGTSIGANVAESQRAQGDKDFLAKMYVAAKEASETEYWLKLLRKADIITDVEYQSLNNDLNEIVKLLMSITKRLEDKIKQAKS